MRKALSQPKVIYTTHKILSALFPLALFAIIGANGAASQTIRLACRALDQQVASLMPAISLVVNLGSKTVTYSNGRTVNAAVNEQTITWQDDRDIPGCPSRFEINRITNIYSVTPVAPNRCQMSATQWQCSQAGW